MGRLNQIGRHSDCDIVITFDGTISRQHAWIIYDSKDFILSDVGSSNGILVNGKNMEKESRIRLKGGESLLLGSTLFKFCIIKAGHDSQCNKVSALESDDPTNMINIQ